MLSRGKLSLTTEVSGRTMFVSGRTTFVSGRTLLVSGRGVRGIIVSAGVARGTGTCVVSVTIVVSARPVSSPGCGFREHAANVATAAKITALLERFVPKLI